RINELKTVLIGSVSTRNPTTGLADAAQTMVLAQADGTAEPADAAPAAGDEMQPSVSGATGPDEAEITVYGVRSARARSLEQQRAAENGSFVLSSDQLGNFNGTTISEALRRAPGIAFQRDPVTGDGTNIIIRG